jgi:hypothetical protein
MGIAAKTNAIYFCIDNFYKSQIKQKQALDLVKMDAISGAVISVEGITQDIVTKMKLLKSHNQ